MTDFQQPLGMKLREDKPWVKKAQIIPWSKIEVRYAALFPSKTGNVAKPLRRALGALIIYLEYGYADEELALQIQENPYLQYFCGYPSFDDSKPPFDASLIVHFRKRTTPEILAEINEMIIREAQDDKDDDNDDRTKPERTQRSGSACFMIWQTGKAPMLSQGSKKGLSEIRT